MKRSFEGCEVGEGASRTPVEEDGLGGAASRISGPGSAATDLAVAAGCAAVLIIGTATCAIAPGHVFRDCDECPEAVGVPSGSLRGDTITYSLAVGVYEVTFDEWSACVRAGGCGGYRPDDEGWGRGSRPVINVSWEDAREYVLWLSRETGQEYRLLSESEWVYVARAGTETVRYWGETMQAQYWGAERDPGQCRYANGYDRTAEAKHGRGYLTDCSDGYAETVPVGMYEANAYGLHDVLGNVWEWTRDCWKDEHGGAVPANGDCPLRVLRGGSWLTAPKHLHSALRGKFSSDFRSYVIGFRVVRIVTESSIKSTPAPHVSSSRGRKKAHLQMPARAC